MPDAPATTPTPLQVSDADVAAIDAMRTLHAQLRAEVAKVIIGQDQVIEELLIAILSRGHALLMGVPGLARSEEHTSELQSH